ncbi:uncharacterized protein LOC144107497 isoform X2 [Amblyomma americanum]
MAKGKKAKSPAKGKKGKGGSKAKPAGKGSSPGKAASATPSQEQSATQQLTTGSSQDITAGSTASLIPGQSGAPTSQAELFKPLNRPMLPPLVLPADRSLSLTRRPSPIIVREWGDVWFFPVSVLAMALVVLGMITLTLHMKAEDMVGEPDNDTSVSNATAGTEAESTAFSSLTLPTTFSKPKETMETPEHEPKETMETPEHEPKETMQTPEHEPKDTMQTPEHEPKETMETPEQEPKETMETPEHEPKETMETPEHEPKETMQTPEHEPKETMETPEHEPSASVPTPEEEFTETDADVEATATALPIGTDDVPLASTSVKEDREAASTKGSWRSLGDPGKSSNDDMAKNSLDLS